MSDTDDLPEVFRIKVPNPGAYFSIGTDDQRVTNGHSYQGILGEASNGGIFFGAGGLPVGGVSLASQYEGFQKATTAITVPVAGLNAAALLLRTALLGRDSTMIDYAVDGAVFGLTAFKAIYMGIKDGVPSEGGSVSLYGDSGVSATSPLFFTATGGIIASLNAGVACSVNAVGAASINGLIASAYGLMKAAIVGGEAEAIGSSKATLAARNGDVEIQGKNVIVGRASHPEVPGKVYKDGLLGMLGLGRQDATEQVHVYAEERITLEPGKGFDNVRGAPTKISVTKDTVRAETTSSALMVGEEALLYSGSAVVQAGSSGVTLAFGAANIKEAIEAALDVADATKKAAHLAADETKKTLDIAAGTAIATALGFGASSIASAVGAITATTDGGEAAAIVAGGTVAGTALAALATAGIMKAVEKYMTAKARAAAHKAADEAYALEVESAVELEQTMLDAMLALPTTPTVKLASGSITIGFGPLSCITITPTSIDIKSTAVTVNGQPFNMGLPQAVAVNA